MAGVSRKKGEFHSLNDSDYSLRMKDLWPELQGELWELTLLPACHAAHRGLRPLLISEVPVTGTFLLSKLVGNRQCPK